MESTTGITHKDIWATRGFSTEINVLHTETLGAILGKAIDRLTSDQQFLSGDEWANKYRTMGKRSRYTKWDSTLTPYLIEIADTLSSTEPETKIVVVGKPTQMGGSEVALNEVLRRTHIDPCSILYYMENEKKVKSWLVERLDPSLQQPPFNGMGIRSFGLNREFIGGSIIMNGIGSPSALSSITARFVVGDEAARYPLTIGDEGDFLSLAEGRIKTFGDHGKILLVSSFIDKSDEEGSFYNAYKKGDQRVFKCLCKYCEEYTLWSLETLIKDGKEFGQVCEHCGSVTYDNEDRLEAGLAGEWCATTIRLAPDVTSFKINGFVAHPSWLPWSKVWLAHQDCLAGRKSMKSFYNTILGEPYEDGEARTPSLDRARMVMTSVKYKQGVVPDDVLFLTMAIDVQKNYLDCEVKGWCEDMTSYSIKREKIDVNIENVRMASTKIRGIINQKISGLKIWLTCIDVSYKSQHVYKLIGGFPNHNRAVGGTRGCIIGTRGNNVAYNEKLIVAEPFATNKGGKRGMNPYFRTGVDYAKRELYDVLNSDTVYGEESVGRVYAPYDYPDSYFREVIGESMNAIKNPKTGKVQRIFVQKTGKANEALDLHVMNRVAMEILKLPYWDEKQINTLKESIRKIRNPEDTLVSDVMAVTLTKAQKKHKYDKRRAERARKRREKLA